MSFAVIQNAENWYKPWFVDQKQHLLDAVIFNNTTADTSVIISGGILHKSAGSYYQFSIKCFKRTPACQVTLSLWLKEINCLMFV